MGESSDYRESTDKYNEMNNFFVTVKVDSEMVPKVGNNMTLDRLWREFKDQSGEVSSRVLGGS